MLDNAAEEVLLSKGPVGIFVGVTGLFAAYLAAP